MKKKLDFRSFTQKAKSAGKAIPLAVAISMLSSGTALGAVDEMKVDMGNGELWTINQDLMQDPSMRTRALAALNNAFKTNESIFVGDPATGTWVNFSQTAGQGVMIAGIWGDPSIQHVSDDDLDQGYGTYNA